MTNITPIAITAGITLITSWFGGYFLNFPAQSAEAIEGIKTELSLTNTKVDKVCVYSINQADRMDKNLQSIAKALKVDVVTGNDKDNPCIK